MTRSENAQLIASLKSQRTISSTEVARREHAKDMHSYTAEARFSAKGQGV